MIEIISGFWISTKNQSKKNNLIEKQNIRLFIDCDKDLQINTRFITQTQLTNILKNKCREIYNSLNNYKYVLIYCNNLTNSLLLLVSYFIIYGSLNLIDSVKIIHNKINTSYFPSKEHSDILKLLYKSINQ